MIYIYRFSIFQRQNKTFLTYGDGGGANFQENIYPCAKDEEDKTEKKVERTYKDETDEGRMNEKDEESVSEDEEWNGGLFMFPGNNIRSLIKGTVHVSR